MHSKIVDRLIIKPLQDNECAVAGCTDSTSSSGLMCSRHWRLVPNVLQKNYEWAKKQALLAVKAGEELRRRDE